MAGASDKARFFLEQSVPELKEWEKKKIFSPEEISSVTKKRSDFEHKVNARGSTPSDYARYVEFEINVDSLRKKRVKRLGVKSVAHSGQKRIFFLFDRATKKFPGDLGLWMQSIEYARRQRAFKKLAQTLTAALRLHPQKPDLWIYAARFSMEENADVMESRSYMQRGLRFCKTSRNLWLEYTKLELLYIAKITARRQILGVGNTKLQDVQAIDTELDDDMISVPRLTAEDINPTHGNGDDVDRAALEKLEQSPALNGAIPLAIFDAAVKQFNNDIALAKSFYDLVDEFDELACQKNILRHIVQIMLESDGEAWQTQSCDVKAELAGLQVISPDFPPALGVSLGRMRRYLGQSTEPSELAHDLQQCLTALLKDPDLDPALEMVLSSAVITLESYQSDNAVAETH